MKYFNAEEALETCRPVLPNMRFSTPVVECVFDSYSQEPRRIYICKEKGGETEGFSQKLRIRRWGLDSQKTVAWLLFAQGFEDFKDIVIHKIIWHKPEELLYFKHHPLYLGEKISDERVAELKRFPLIDTETYYIDRSKTSTLRNAINILDSSLRGGITLRDSHEIKWDWNYLELMRQFDGTKVCCEWNPSKTCSISDSMISDITNTMDMLIQDCQHTVHSMEIAYSVPPKVIKDCVYFGMPVEEEL